MRVEPLVSKLTGAEVERLQDRYGREHLAQALERTFGGLATRLRDAGVQRIVVAGGETSGAVVTALGIRAFALGPEIAPGVQLDMRPSGTMDLADCLDRGAIDIVLSAMDSPGERFVAEHLMDDRFTILMRKDHKAGEGPICAEALAHLPHLEISSSGEDTRFIDRWLAGKGFARRIGLPAASQPSRPAASEWPSSPRRCKAPSVVRWLVPGKISLYPPPKPAWRWGSTEPIRMRRSASATGRNTRTGIPSGVRPRST